MLVLTLGSAMMYYFTTQAFQIADKPAGAVYYTEVADSRQSNFSRFHQPVITSKPLIENQFRGIVRQAYDYSCGSAALTTLLNGYLGLNLTEQQTMDGLMKYGEYDRIVERRSFSLLDMKRYMTALGYESGGFRGDFNDLIALDKPAIIPISYAGFKHFVVYKAHGEGRVFLADPALGNISFTDNHFKDVWENNTLFIVTPNAGATTSNLLALQDHDMRIVDDATINQVAFYQAALPSHRAERLADIASTMQRVLDVDTKSDTYQQPIDTSLRLYYKRK